MIKFGSGSYTLDLSIGRLPLNYDAYLRHAQLHDDLGICGEGGEAAFVAVKGNGADWPHLTVAFRRRGIPGFPVGVLLVPDTDVLLLGSDETLLAYDLRRPGKLWADFTWVGFWGWERHQDIVLMIAECELAAFSLHGERLWSEPVESPWTFAVDGDKLDLDVMGTRSLLSLRKGR